MTFKVESAPNLVGEQAPLYVRTDTDRVGINVTNPAVPLEVKSEGTNTTIVRLLASDGSALLNMIETSGGASSVLWRDAAGSIVNDIRAAAYSYIANAFGLTVGSASHDASSILQCDSTTQGFLPPRVTTTEKNAIASPATGLVVFDTTLGKLCVYGGAAWQTVTSV